MSDLPNLKKKVIKIKTDDTVVTEISPEKYVRFTFESMEDFNLKKAQIDKRDAVKIGPYIYSYNVQEKEWLPVLPTVGDGSSGALRHTHDNLVDLDRIPNFPERPDGKVDSKDYLFKYVRDPETGEYLIALDVRGGDSLPDLPVTEEPYLYLKAKRELSGEYTFHWERKDDNFPLPDDSARTKFLISKDGTTSWDAVAIPAQSFETHEVEINAANVANGYLEFANVNYIERADKPIIFAGPYFQAYDTVDYDAWNKSLKVNFEITDNLIGQRATLLLIKNSAGNIMSKVEQLFELFDKFRFTTGMTLYANSDKTLTEYIKPETMMIGGPVYSAMTFDIGTYTTNVTKEDVYFLAKQGFVIRLPYALSVGLSANFHAQLILRSYDDKNKATDKVLCQVIKSDVRGTGKNDTLIMSMFVGETTESEAADFILKMWVTFSADGEFWAFSQDGSRFTITTESSLQAISDRDISVSSGGSLKEYLETNDRDKDDIHDALYYQRVRWYPLGERNTDSPSTEIEFQLGTLAQYEALKTKDPYTFYYLSDSGQVYMGDMLFNNRVKQVEIFPTLQNADRSILYVHSVTHECKMVNADRSGWIIFFRPNVFELKDDADDTTLPTTKAVKDYVDSSIAALPKDVFVQSATYDKERNVLILKFSAYEDDVEIPLGDLFDIYNGASTESAVTEINAISSGVQLKSKVWSMNGNVFVKYVSGRIYRSNDGDHWNIINTRPSEIEDFFILGGKLMLLKSNSTWYYSQSLDNGFAPFIHHGHPVEDLTGCEKNVSECYLLARHLETDASDAVVSVVMGFEGTYERAVTDTQWVEIPSVIQDFEPISFQMWDESTANFVFQSGNTLYKTFDAFENITVLSGIVGRGVNWLLTNDYTALGKNNGEVEVFFRSGEVKQYTVDSGLGDTDVWVSNYNPQHPSILEITEYAEFPTSDKPKRASWNTETKELDTSFEGSTEYLYTTPIMVAKVNNGLMVGVAFNYNFLSVSGTTWIHHADANSNTISVRVRTSANENNIVRVLKDGVFVPLHIGMETDSAKVTVKGSDPVDGVAYNQQVSVDVKVANTSTNTLEVTEDGLLNKRLTPVETASVRINHDKDHGTDISADVLLSKETFNAAQIKTDGLYIGNFQEFPSLSAFPNVGKEYTAYVDRTENKTYRWDEKEQRYIVIGSDYRDIKEIYGGHAKM